MRGKGKTNYIKFKALPLTPLYVIDIRNEFKHLPAFISVQNFSYWLLDKPERKSRWLVRPIISGHNKPEQYRFTLNSEEELETLFRMLSSLRNCTLIIDEADALFQYRKFNRPLINIFLGSRNNNVSLIFITKRPYLLPIIVRSQADRFTIFCTEEEKDISYLEGRVKQDFPKDIDRLERGEAVVIESGSKPRIETYEKFPLD